MQWALYAHCTEPVLIQLVYMYGNSICTVNGIFTGTVPVQWVVYVREKYQEELRVQAVETISNRITDCEDDVKTEIKYLNFLIFL